MAIMKGRKDNVLKQWLIPAIVLLAVGGMGLGVGWSVNEWKDGDEAAPVQTGPTQAELDAQRCEAALEAAGNVQPSGGGYSSLTRGESGTHIVIPQEIRDAIDRYCH